MGAYNTIIIDQPCPECGVRGKLSTQCHMASSFGGIAERFALRTYRIGEQMAWWPESDSRYSQWIDINGVRNPDGTVEECCYSFCNNCGVDSFAVIRFADRVPVLIVSLGKMKDWPAGYPM